MLIASTRSWLPSLSFSIIAIGALSISPISLALFADPTSVATTTKSLMFFSIYVRDNSGIASSSSTGMLKNP